MTTSLPTSSPEESLAASGHAAGLPLNGDLAALLAATATPPASAPAAAPLNFGAILGAGPAAGQPAAAAAAPLPATVPLPADPARPETDLTNLPSAPPTDARGVTAMPVVRRVALTAPADTAVIPDRTTLEQALALLLPLLAPLGESAPIIAPAAEVATAPVPAADAPAPAGSPAVMAAPSGPGPARVTLILAGGQKVELRGVRTSDASAPLAALLGPAAAGPVESLAGSVTPARRPQAADSTPAQSAPAALATPSEPANPHPHSPALAPSGRVPQSTSAASTHGSAAAVRGPEILAPAENSAGAPSPAEPRAASKADELVADVDLPDGAQLQIEIPIAPRGPIGAGAGESAVATTQVEKSAALPAPGRAENFPGRNPAGKNFLSAKNEGVNPLPQKAGIGVAQADAPMFLPPQAALPAVEPTVAAHAAVASGAATERVPMPELTAASLAHRAVEAVTHIVDAQAAAKLQPVPSVQLKFRVGADDLAVRVELRAGVVRTEFRTDSPELRAALTQEWNTVVAQPETALRYLEPVFSPATARGDGAFAHTPGHPQHFSQQHQHPQQQPRATELFGSVARSTPYQPREGGAASPAVVPLVAPTSHHLSAVA